MKKNNFVFYFALMSHVCIYAQSACIEITKNSNSEYSFALKGSSVPVTIIDYTFDISIQQKDDNGNNIGSSTIYQAALGSGADIVLNNTTTTVGLVPSNTVNLTLASNSASVSFSISFNEIAYQGVAGVQSVNICGFSNFVLPVELLNFQARNQGKSNFLTWQTASETNNNGFEIQRSAEGKTFESLSFVKGHGTTAEKQSYSFADETPLSISYYRLKQMDFDGKFKYSPVKSVFLRQAKTSTIKIYPNPTSDESYLNIISPDETTTSVKLYNANGQIVKQLLSKVVAGSNTIPLDMWSLPTGIYLITLEVNNIPFSMKISKN